MLLDGPASPGAEPAPAGVLSRNAAFFHREALAAQATASGPVAAFEVAAGPFAALGGWRSAVETDGEGNLWLLTWPGAFGAEGARFSKADLDGMRAALAGALPRGTYLGKWEPTVRASRGKVGPVEFSQPGGVGVPEGAPVLATPL